MQIIERLFLADIAKADLHILISQRNCLVCLFWRKTLFFKFFCCLIRKANMTSMAVLNWSFFDVLAYLARTYEASYHVVRLWLLMQLNVFFRNQISKDNFINLDPIFYLLIFIRVLAVYALFNYVVDFPCYYESFPSRFVIIFHRIDWIIVKRYLLKFMITAWTTL